MKLSIICEPNKEAILDKINLGFDALEFTIGEDATLFLAEQFNEIASVLKEKKCEVSSIGQWGAIKHQDGILCQSQLEIDKQLINLCASIGCKCFTTGFNFDDKYTRFQNLKRCIEYYQIIVSYAKEKNIEVCNYNCDWNNFVFSIKEWEVILDEVPELRVKYDPSHSFYRGVDYLKEINFLGDRIAHVHLKGAMLVDGERIDDPPVGLDQLDWKTIIVLLRIHRYNHYLSIEPHAILEELKDNDADIIMTKNYIEKLIH